MQIGLNCTARRLDAILDDAQRTEAEGFACLSLASISGHDAIGALTLAGARTSRIELLTAVVPIYLSHPAALAQQAVTAQTAARGRFTLGIGLSHQVVIEGVYGLSFARPAAAMREYLAILRPLLRGEEVHVPGERYTMHGSLRTSERADVSVVIAALGPVMLRLAGEVADGTVLWMTAAKAVAEHIAPRLRKAAAAAGRPEPRIICSLPIALTNDAAAARSAANTMFAMYGNLPSYRAMLDKAGAAAPGDAALVGDERALDAELRRLQEAGVTLFNGSPFPADEGAVQRTREYLADRAKRGM